MFAICPECHTQVELHREGWFYDHARGDELCPGSGMDPGDPPNLVDDVGTPDTPAHVHIIDKMLADQVKVLFALTGNNGKVGGDFVGDDPHGVLFAICVRASQMYVDRWRARDTPEGSLVAAMATVDDLADPRRAGDPDALARTYKALYLDALSDNLKPEDQESPK